MDIFVFWIKFWVFWVLNIFGYFFDFRVFFLFWLFGYFESVLVLNTRTEPVILRTQITCMLWVVELQTRTDSDQKGTNPNQNWFIFKYLVGPNVEHPRNSDLKGTYLYSIGRPECSHYILWAFIKFKSVKLKIHLGAMVFIDFWGIKWLRWNGIFIISGIWKVAKK